MRKTPDYIVITEVVDSSEHKQDSNQVVDGVAQTLDPDLLNEILAQTSEVGEYQIYVKNDDELLISGPVPIQTANEDVNYPTLESSLDSASIYLGQKNRYKLATKKTHSQVLLWLKNKILYDYHKKTWISCPSLLYVMTEL